MKPTQVPEEPDESQLAEMHLRGALLSARVLLPTFFIIGFIGGTSVRLWASNKAAAVVSVGFSLIVAIWLWLVYHRTDGFMRDPSMIRGPIEPE